MTDRRDVLKWIAAGAAASLAACRRPDDTIEPMTVQPEGTHPGVVRRYATALPLAGYLRGVTGLVVDGRPIKLEGLATHPASLGATDVFTESAILDLYDPQRLKAVTGPDGPSSWPALAKALFERAAPRRGTGTVILTGRVTSPTLLARIAALQAAMPGVRHIRWEPFDDDAVLAGTHAAFDRALTPRPRLAEADVVLSLDADPLGPGPEQVALARAWATRRRTGVMPRWFQLEASPSATGVMADARVPADPRQIALACRALAAALAGGDVPGGIAADVAALLAQAAPALAAARGRALVLAGAGQPAAVHAFAAWANARLAAPVDYLAPVDGMTAPHRASLAALARAMHAGEVDTLLILGANPCYAAPPEFRFAAGMDRVPLKVVATVFPNETSARADWAVPLSHPLEAWHDGRAPDGTATIAQPLVRPFHDTRTATEVVDLVLNPAAGRSGASRVRDQWRGLDDAAWGAALVTGIVPGTAPTPATTGSPTLVLPDVPAPAALALDLRPSPTLFDGCASTNAWAQECPDTLTKEVWGSSVRLHPADMTALGVADGDLVRIRRGGSVTLPVRAVAGQARGTATLLAGYGRDGTGAVADGIGANGFVLAGAGDASIVKVEGSIAVPTTQHHFALPGELAELFPVLAPGERARTEAPLPSMLPNPPARDNAPPQWAMAIDTDVCIGCNACVVACQAENNVPAIGPEEIARGRDMHWLRVDRYDHDGAAGGGGGFQPVPCMQCEAAPCEPVCPVEASVHDAQGLNLQVYNRCVGTRTCQANCPYKVRRFNFLDYAGASVWGDAEDASISAQRNPDVTVRARGVMEKCTYCVQRIEAHAREADAGGDPAPVVTACQAACPTRAIGFGPLESDAIRGARADPRHYALLEHLGTRPRTTYLARRRNGDAT